MNKRTGRRPEKDVFYEVKLKMVMRLRGLSREEAEFALRMEELSEGEHKREKRFPIRRGSVDIGSDELLLKDDGLITADEFFGGDA